MKTALKIAAAAALMTVAVQATPGNSKQNNYYKASITGNVLVQQGDDYDKVKLNTDDVITALLDSTGLLWDVKKTSLIMQIGPDEDALKGVSFWLVYKKGKEMMKRNVDDFMSVKGGEYIVYKRKYSAKGDNEKVRSEFTDALVKVNTLALKFGVRPAGTADVTIKGMKTEPYLNNVKLRTSGNGATDADEPLTLDFKVKGRMSNADFNAASDVTPMPVA